MTQPLTLPSQVRCNRGFGWPFWMVMGIVAPMTVVTVIGIWDREPGGGLVGLGIGAAVALLFCVVRAVFLPRLTIDLAQGVLRARTRTAPFSAIAVIEFVSEKAGVWATFIDDDGRKLARMSVANTMFAPPTSEQWAALGQVIHLAAIARGASLAQQPPAPGIWVSPARAIDILQAQTAWCSAGHRSSGRQAPAAELTHASVALAGQEKRTHAARSPR
ncbi:hypothetical protein NF556_04885 [Ornithinimicrobium faecis]|uniref:PH (Pleckstrin Homology) domain-containing protein n=1 Tax=Ornithinimicrobium faecis TaxID=2934158 RepID=A0ABY4YWL2_9MICO|nr:hypothetical protein [Ornithinimicrobium sp. HY1793]USQ80987.1 hypothetical protein NF556_04885 [Ornithinimicrobium sp. HY1793]